MTTNESDYGYDGGCACEDGYEDEDDRDREDGYDDEDDREGEDDWGPFTRMLAGMCHRCGICPFAERRPGSAFARMMRWHRGWCPAWSAHTKVYGEKPLGCEARGAA